MSNKQRRKAKSAKRATATSPTLGTNPTSASQTSEQLDPHVDSHQSGKSTGRPPEGTSSPLSVHGSLVPTDPGGDATSELRAEVNATVAALLTDMAGMHSDDETDDNQLVMPSGDQGVVFSAQREGASLGEPASNLLGSKIFRRGPSPRISRLVDPHVSSVGAVGSRRPSMVVSTRRLSSINTNAEAGMFTLKELQQWSTERWIEADQEIAVFTDEVAGAIAQITKVSVDLHAKLARLRTEYRQLNKALQAKLDATERVLSGQNNVSSVFSYAMGSGGGYAVLPSPVPSVESLPTGPNTRVPSKKGSISPRSFLVDCTAGRETGTDMVPETLFPAHDTSDANILASILHLGEGRHLPNESVLDYDHR
ncbi:hypothetical protein JAAARDRAFT_189012 [Jaapia argillacea MUCL 33604]|uniref:Uncharacterized protein n=1 Tax=Jaapia argillacea MUCL 33604 TaxID=933084 RepID=A0A067QBE2_9AGAM|nr:hypothetical protein JAAARDRAFT_189012 [Jaapia argillacea MUCL 33604]